MYLTKSGSTRPPGAESNQISPTGRLCRLRPNAGGSAQRPQGFSTARAFNFITTGPFRQGSWSELPACYRGQMVDFSLSDAVTGAAFTQVSV
jgi:hypothetical protein